MSELLLATHNHKKLLELQYVLTQAELTGINLCSLTDFPDFPEPLENGVSFQENALIKAHAAAQYSGLACLADDSGLQVDILNGMPGIFSARWAGQASDTPRELKDSANRDLLLAQISDVPDAYRTANFISVCALVTREMQEIICEGKWAGFILREPQGTGGFGYDPIFAPQDIHNQAGGDFLPISQHAKVSAAQLTAEHKNRISHRARALAEVIQHIQVLIKAGKL